MSRQPTKELEQKLLFEKERYNYKINHLEFNDTVSYVKGNMNPELFPLLLTYIQFQMNEVQKEIMLFPQDIQQILVNLYGFTTITECDDCQAVELTETFKKNEGLEHAVLLFPFYRKGLYQELQSIVQSILVYFNGVDNKDK